LLTLGVLLGSGIAACRLAGQNGARENSGLRNVGQFLAGPGALLNEPALRGIAGLAVLALTLAMVTRLIPRPLLQQARPMPLAACLVIMAGFGIGMVLLLQWAAAAITEFTGPGVGRPVPGDQLGGFILATGHLVGWGYSLSVQPASFDTHLLGF